MSALCETLTTRDGQLKRQIVSQLAQSGRTRVRQLAVDVHDGRVTLRGSVGSFYEKRLALHACVAGAVADRLVDAIEVAPNS